MADEIVLVHYAESGPEAVVIESLLKDAGIEYIMRGSTPGMVDYGFNTYATLGAPIEFLVHINDLESAREAIKTAAELEKDAW
jgi:hypothetical protein